ncbi:hypothetical protein [uncultured Kordia sp.]|uniref:hypothetical protein n=1 Tax=uncultured Kordia sp. TaxID=507699 RepID=UPI0026082FA4|nr:hypothetical protein [uncultured Kordia sp.]
MQYLKSTCIILLFVFLISCEKNIPLFNPLHELEIGMNKSSSEEVIKHYRDDTIIVNDRILINDIEADISFLYCKTCFNMSLSGVILKTDEPDKLIDFLKMDYEHINNIVIAEYSLRSSLDLFVHFSDAVCIYDKTKVHYLDEMSIIKCKKSKADPCWE